MARGSRVLGVAGFLVAVAASVGEGANDGEDVLYVLPTNGQEVQPDLSDPGLDGAVTIRLGHRLRRWQRRLLHWDSENTFNDSGPAVSLYSRDFGRAAGDPEYDRRAMTLTLRPTLPLPPGQYTLTVDGQLLIRTRRVRGYVLNSTPSVLRSSFTVGSDSYSPRIRDTTPAQLQSDTPRFFPISIVFNESLDPASVVLGSTVLVEDAGGASPMPVEGLLTLEEDGFLVWFRPDPVAGFPAASRIRVRFLGAGHPECVRDRVENSLEADYVLEFETKAL